MASPTGLIETDKKVSRRREYLLGALGLVLTLAFCALVIIYWDQVTFLTQLEVPLGMIQTSGYSG